MEVEHSGEVVDVHRNGISGVMVSVMGKTGKCYQTYSDSDGRFNVKTKEEWEYIYAQKEGFNFMFNDQYSPIRNNNEILFVGWPTLSKQKLELDEIGKIYSPEDAIEIKLNRHLNISFKGIGSESLSIEMDNFRVALGDFRYGLPLATEDFVGELVLDKEELKLINRVYFVGDSVNGWVNFSIRSKAGVLVIDVVKTDSIIKNMLYPSHAYNGFYNDLIINGKQAFTNYRKALTADCYK